MENALQSQRLVLRPGEHSLRVGLEGWFSTMAERGTLKALEEYMLTYAKSHTPQFHQNFWSAAGTLVVVFFCCVHSAPQVTNCSQAVNR